MLKRAFDISLSVVLLVILALPMVVLVYAIRRDSPGSAVFRQKRVGRHGELFTCLKLRTMRTGIAHRPTHEASASDITRLGSLLRKLKLDEVPQLWNVIRGDMSLVGPRPCLPSQAELIEARKRLGVLELRPGITGVAQIAGVDMSEPQNLANKDAEYLGRWSLMRDLAILIGTVSPIALSDRVKE